MVGDDENWDVSLLSALLRFSALSGTAAGAAAGAGGGVKAVSATRNKCAHAAGGRISDADMESAWSTLRDALAEDPLRGDRAHMDGLRTGPTDPEKLVIFPLQTIPAAEEAAKQAKEEGNRQVRAERWADAVAAYTLGIGWSGVVSSPLLGQLYANRSLAHAKMCQFVQARRDATQATELCPGWPKAFVRLATACEALGKFKAGASAWERVMGMVSIAMAPEEVEELRSLAAEGMQRCRRLSSPGTGVDPDDASAATSDLAQRRDRLRTSASEGNVDAMLDLCALHESLSEIETALRWAVAAGKFGSPRARDKIAALHARAKSAPSAPSPSASAAGAASGTEVVAAAAAARGGDVLSGRHRHPLLRASVSSLIQQYRIHSTQSARSTAAMPAHFIKAPFSISFPAFNPGDAVLRERQSCRPILVDEMLAWMEPRVHTGRVLECVVVALSVKMLADTVFVEDSCREPIIVSIYNLTPAQSATLVVGRVLRLFNPFAKLSMDGRWMVRVDNPAGSLELTPTVHRMCWNCMLVAGEDTSLGMCSGCNTARYCSMECQRQDWKQYGHKEMCKRLSS